MVLKSYDQLQQCAPLLLVPAKTERSVFPNGFSGHGAPKTIASAPEFPIPPPFSAAMKLTYELTQNAQGEGYLKEA